MTDESSGDVIPTETRVLDGEFRRPGETDRPVTDATGVDRTWQQEETVAPPSDGIRDLLLGISGTVVDSRSLEALERTVCERLVDSSHYRSAWIGQHVPATDGITVQHSAGFDGRLADAVAVQAGSGESPGRSVWDSVLDDGTVQVLDAGDRGFEPWWKSGGDSCIESAAAVPLSHDGSAYGVLGLATARSGAFDAVERQALGVVGGVVGATVGAIRNRELLYADRIVELELRVTDPSSTLVRASEGLGCRISLDGSVATGDRWLLYWDVEGVDAEAVATTVGQYRGVDDCRIVHNREGRRRLELTAAGSSTLCQAATAGARVRSAVADDGVCRAVVEVPRSASVREVLSRLRESSPGLELRSLREHDRPPADPDVSGGVLDDLTDRQRDVLEAAYSAGYFDWPRGSTAEEVADALGITGPTFLGHIRKAERHLLADLLD